MREGGSPKGFAINGSPPVRWNDRKTFFNFLLTLNLEISPLSYEPSAFSLIYY
jgi:hypothetical protein